MSAKLVARVRVFSTGNGRKTDPVDGHSVAVAALRADLLNEIRGDDALVDRKLRSLEKRIAAAVAETGTAGNPPG